MQKPLRPGCRLSVPRATRNMLTATRRGPGDTPTKAVHSYGSKAVRGRTLVGAEYNALPDPDGTRHGKPRPKEHHVARTRRRGDVLATQRRDGADCRGQCHHAVTGSGRSNTPGVGGTAGIPKVSRDTNAIQCPPSSPVTVMTAQLPYTAHLVDPPLRFPGLFQA